MATTIPIVNISSSPPSGGTRTHHGTPSTIPTIMSPDAGNDGFDNSAGIPKLELTNNNSNLATRRNLSVAPVAIPSRLSPTAEDFTPSADNSTFTIIGPNARFDAQAQQGYSPVSTALFDSAPGSILSGGALTLSLQKRPGVIGSGPHTQSAAVQRAPVYRFGIFTSEDEVTRAFVVSGVGGTSVPSLYEYIAISYKNFGSIVNINAQHLNKGIFSVEFTDYDEAKQALFLTVDFIFYNQSVRCYRLYPQDIARQNGLASNSVSNHVAEYIVSLVDVGARTSNITGDDVFQTCKACGKVKAFHTFRTLPGAVMSFHVEWSDARTNATRLSMALLSGYRITIMPYTPDIIPTSVAAGPARFSNSSFDSDEHTRNVMAFLQPETPNRINISTTHNVVDIMKIMLGQDVRTTIMLRNIPNRVDQATLKKLLDETSFGQYDFMYLRIDFANNCNVGYAFINFVDPMAIVPFAKARAGQKWNLFQSDKVAEISYATIQGRDCLIQKFRNSSVMLERPAFRPKLYRTGSGPSAGTEEEFPKPDNHAKLKRSCDNAEHVGLYLPEFPADVGSCVTFNGPSIVPPPRNQKAGGAYTKPAQTRGAIAFNKALALLEDTVQYEDTLSLPPSPNSSSPLSLYAPREGQAYRERQRRHYSQFDRGTPGAESELATLPGRLGSAISRNVSESEYGGMAVGPPFRAANTGVSATDHASGPVFVNRPVQPPINDIGYSPRNYLPRSFQELKV